MTPIADLYAFFQQHQYCGGLDDGGEGDRIWMTCTCGARIEYVRRENRVRHHGPARAERTWEDLDRHSKAAFEKQGRDPRLWVRFAKDLHRAAGLLWDQGGPGLEKLDWLSSVGKIAMMLEGYAVEMFAKAVLVRRNPDSVKDGRWLGPRTGHPLLELLEEIGFTLSPEERDLVARLAGFASRAGRYPIPKDYRKTTAKRRPDGLIELAPGTFFTGEDRSHVARLIERLVALTSEGPKVVDS